MIVDNLRLVGEKIWLRPLQVSDASEEYCVWLNDPVVNKYLETRQATIADLKMYITEKLASAESLFLGIFWKENDKHIGNIKLEPIDFAKKSATLGILIGDKDYWGKGVATEAVRLLSAYAFETMDLQTLNLGVISENKAAVEVYKKCGFVIEHSEPNAVNHDGSLFDKVWMKKTK